MPTTQTNVLDATNALADAVAALEHAAALWDDHGLQLTILDVKSLYQRSCEILNHHAQDEAA
jgi:hypothetical protein